MPNLVTPSVCRRGTSGRSSLPAHSEFNRESHTSSFQLRPLQVTWEMRQSFDWRATPAPSAARPRRATRARRPTGNERDFSTVEAFHLIEEVAAMHVPLLMLTGGDPLRRADLFPILEFAERRSVRTSLTLRPSPLLDRETICELKARGVVRVAFWLHGSTAGLDDGYWKIAGAHRQTLDAVGSCHDVDLPVQINTVIARRNFHDIDPMTELLTRLDVALWNVFFFVPASRDQAAELLTAEEYEKVFGKLYAASKRVQFQIKTTEGQHYQRYLLQQRTRESRGRLTETQVIACALDEADEGGSSVFINHQGEVYPSRYLPLSAGNVTTRSLLEIFYDAPLLVSLRDRSRLKGKCGRCEVRAVCGGSRARAYALTGDPFAEDPCCAYEPTRRRKQFPNRESNHGQV